VTTNYKWTLHHFDIDNIFNRIWFTLSSTSFTTEILFNDHGLSKSDTTLEKLQVSKLKLAFHQNFITNHTSPICKILGFSMQQVSIAVVEILLEIKTLFNTILFTKFFCHKFKMMYNRSIMKKLT